MNNDICLNCRHWQFSEEDAAGNRRPGWMIPHGMSACGRGERFRAFGRAHCCGNGKFEGLPEADAAKRAAWLDKNVR